MATIKQDKDLQSGDRSKSYALIESKIVPHFDFVRMTRLALGKNWNQASPEQQKSNDPLAATLRRLEGAFSLAFLYPDRIERQARMIAYAPKMMAVLQALVEQTKSEPENVPDDIAALAQEAKAIARYVDQDAPQ